MVKVNVYKKSALLKAMKSILSEYKRNIHTASVTVCSLCKLYHRDNQNKNDGISKGHECRLCPMHVFHRGNKYDFDFYSCMSRRCTPVDCDSMTKDTNELKAVIELYEQAIAKVESMTSEELNAPKAFSFLIKIDKLVAKEFCLV